MIGASSGLRPNQPELTTASSTMPDIASSKPPSNAAQCSALPLKSATAGQCGSARVSARMTQTRYGSTSTTNTNSANSGSNDHSVRPARAVASANPTSSSNRPIAAEVVSSSRPASMDHANQALRRPWPISCQVCSSSSAQSGRASTRGPNSTPGELNAVTVIVSKTASTACCPPTTARASRYSAQSVTIEQSCANRETPNMLLAAARKAISASQNASGGPRSVPTRYSRP